MIEQLEAGEMPPEGASRSRRPTSGSSSSPGSAAFLDAEARARAGDPGHVPLRRLSNAEYDYTIRDLTGVDLRPAREFPADGAAGEGFTNAAEALTDISPALLTKYLNAAKDIADHAVLLPDGFRFSPAKTRRDWTDEGTAALRQFYAALRARPTASCRCSRTCSPPSATATRSPPARFDGGRGEGEAEREVPAACCGRRSRTRRRRSRSTRSARKWRAATEKDVPALGGRGGRVAGGAVADGQGRQLRPGELERGRAGTPRA